jgi:hypothetical protein
LGQSIPLSIFFHDAKIHQLKKILVVTLNVLSIVVHECKSTMKTCLSTNKTTNKGDEKGTR